MLHTVIFVAKSHRFDIEAFTAFAATNKNAWEEDGRLVTNTWHCDALISDFLAAGNTRLDWVKTENGMIQPGFLEHP